ncbi:hypothetical protein [Dyella choica]|uniref:DUF2188 domain-containing protein n=1 Tax=Dyella choica TaxID=1927959 RepID=A0A432M7U7_9GAMM|nr:hypothetical protein [Dyella choica]RUL77593.1 hypothetical protein EKH80_06860 [Dyella choica]
MSPADDVIDFYIVLLHYAAIERGSWLICAGPASHCLAVHEDQASAIAHARRMADYRVSAGRAAQIHVRDEGDRFWKTIWCSAGTEPKHP